MVPWGYVGRETMRLALEDWIDNLSADRGEWSKTPAQVCSAEADRCQAPA